MEEQKNINIVENEKTLEENLAAAYSKTYSTRVGYAKIIYKDAIKRKYRKNSSGYKIIASMDLMDQQKTPDIPLFVRKYKDNTDIDDIILEKKLTWQLSNYLKQELPSDTPYLFTGVPGQQRRMQPFLEPIGPDNNYFDNNRLAVVKHIDNDPLDVKIKEGPITWTLAAALDLAVISMDRVPWYTPKIKQLQDLKTLELKDYTKNFFSALDFFDLSAEEKSTIWGNFNDIAEKYLLNKELETIIQKEAYPWHNDCSHFFHIGKPCRGSRALQFGYTFGLPIIFNRFENPEHNIRFLLAETYEDFKRTWLEAQFSMGLQKLDKEMLEKSFYPGAICANANFLNDYKNYLSPEEQRASIDVIVKQFDILSVKGEEKSLEIHDILKSKHAKVPGMLF